MGALHLFSFCSLNIPRLRQCPVFLSLPSLIEQTERQEDLDLGGCSLDLISFLAASILNEIPSLLSVQCDVAPLGVFLMPSMNLVQLSITVANHGPSA